MTDSKLSAISTGTMPDYFYGVEGVSHSAPWTSKKYSGFGWLNVKDFGAVGDGSNDDTTAIRDALTALWAINGGGGTLYFPPGSYKVTDQITISRGSGVNTSGRIIGAGKESTTIIGDVPNGFIFYQGSDGNSNGPNEISNLRLVNSSTWIGSGALQIGNTSAIIENVDFAGMIACLCPYNCFQLTFRNCGGSANSDGSTGRNGSLGIVGYSPNIYQWRSTSNFMICLGSYGTNATVINGCGIENCNQGIVLGAQPSWASSCTASGDVLTIDGDISYGSVFVGAVIFGRGITLPTWGKRWDDTANNGATHITSQLTGTPDGAGTYQLNQSVGTISTPIPIYGLSTGGCGEVDISAIETEGCHYGVYVFSAGGGTINGCDFTGTPTEATDEFGNVGLTSHSGLYVQTSSNLLISGVAANNNGYAGGIYIAPGNVQGTTFVSCTSTKLADNAITATLSNGSGGSGNILNVTAITGSAIGIGMAITGTGIPANSVISGNHVSNGTLTGTGGTGTYTLNNSASLSSRSMVVATQADWVMPSSYKAGVKFIKCSSTIPVGVTSGLNTLNMIFDDLPGNSAGLAFQTFIGDEYTITNGADGLGWGDNCTTTGTTQYLLRWNGTHWTVVGK